jgi:hypothetical protein
MQLDLSKNLSYTVRAALYTKAQTLMSTLAQPRGHANWVPDQGSKCLGMVWLK